MTPAWGDLSLRLAFGVVDGHVMGACLPRFLRTPLSARTFHAVGVDDEKGSEDRAGSVRPGAKTTLGASSMCYVIFASLSARTFHAVGVNREKSQRGC